MPQSSFPNKHWRPQRKSFKAGHIMKLFRYPKSCAAKCFIPRAPNDLINNIPYAGYYGGVKQANNPFGYITGGPLSNRMELNKTPLQRNFLREGRKRQYGYGYPTV